MGVRAQYFFLFSVCQSRATLIFNLDYAVDLLQFNSRLRLTRFHVDKFAESRDNVCALKWCQISKLLKPTIFISNCEYLNRKYETILIFPRFLFTDIPTQIPPLTPGSKKQMTDALKLSFASWEKEIKDCNITKGSYLRFTNTLRFCKKKTKLSEFLCGDDECMKICSFRLPNHSDFVRY